MKAYYYILAILICRVIQAVCSKRTSNEINSIPHLIKYAVFSKLVSAAFALMLLLAEGATAKPTPLAIIISVASGLTLFACSYFSTYAMKSGTVSAVSMFGTAGLLMPLIFGFLAFGQRIKALQWVGVAVFFISSYLLLSNSKKMCSNYSLKTVVLLIGNLVANGSTMITQQLYTRYVPNGSVSLFSFVSFASVGMIGLAFLPTLKYKGADRKANSDTRLTKSLLICGALLAIASFVINQFATICTAFVSPVILFTVINGGGTIISTIVAAMLYQEKLNTRTITGVVLGILSLVMVKAFA